jgi:RNA polymerase sigma factor (sigma-70 family)
MTDDTTLVQWARAAAGGDRGAAEQLLEQVEDTVYRLALRMLGHPEDAEDATQEILLIVLTHLGSFRGESSFRTWCWRIACNHLLKARRGRLERVTFESIAQTLEGALDDARSGEGNELDEAEGRLFAREVRLRCTEAMLLALDRDLRMAFVLTEILALTGEEAAQVLAIDHPTYRKRLSRAREKLLAFMRAHCGLFAPSNACRCEKQVGPALARGQLVPGALLLARHPRRASSMSVERCVVEVDELLRAAEVLRHPDYAAPPGLLARIRALLESGRLELLRS